MRQAKGRRVAAPLLGLSPHDDTLWLKRLKSRGGAAFDVSFAFCHLYCGVATALYVHEDALFPYDPRLDPHAPHTVLPLFRACDRHHVIKPGKLEAGVPISGATDRKQRLQQ